MERHSLVETLGLMSRNDAVACVETLSCGATCMQPVCEKRLCPVQTLFLLLSVVTVGKGKAR